MRPNDIMAGFDVRFETPEQYIVDITHEIWEQGGIDLIESAYYADPCPVYTPLGVSRAARDVTTGTQATLTEFPGPAAAGRRHHHRPEIPRLLFLAPRPLDGNAPRARPLLSTGPSPSGRSVGMLTIADCVCRDNRIVEEWLVRDQAGYGASGRTRSESARRRNRPQQPRGRSPRVRCLGRALGRPRQADSGRRG